MTWLLEKLIAPFVPWIIAASLIANGVLALGFWHRGNVIVDRDKALKEVSAIGEQAKRDKDTAEAKAKAQQKKDTEDYENLMEVYESDLAAANKRLQDRPRRSDVPEVRAECASHAATGSELSREDASFLVRESARANEVTAQLELAQRELRACSALTGIQPK